MFNCLFLQLNCLDKIKARIGIFVRHSGFQKYFKNTAWMFLGQVAGMAIAFFVNILIARYLGPESYGVINYVISFGMLFSFIASLGIDIIVIRELIKAPEQKDKFLGTSFILKIVGGLVALLFIILFSFLEDDVSIRTFLIVYGLIFVCQSFHVISLFFQSAVQAKKSALAQIITNIISAVIKTIAVFMGLGVGWFVFFLVLDAIILSISLLIIGLKNHINPFKWRFDYLLVKNILKDSWPLIFSTMAVSFYMRMDQIMLGNMVNQASVGIYAAAVKFSEVWYVIPSIICGSLFPAIINAKKVSHQSFNRRLRGLYALLFWLAFFIAIIMTFSAKPIIYLLYGQSYMDAAPVLQVHIWATIGAFLGFGVSQYLISENLTKIYFVCTLSGAVINLILNLWLIPVYGAIGAAIATLIAYTLVTFMIVFFKRTRLEVKNISQAIFLKF